MSFIFLVYISGIKLQWQLWTCKSILTRYQTFLIFFSKNGKKKNDMNIYLFINDIITTQRFINNSTWSSEEMKGSYFSLEKFQTCWYLSGHAFTNSDDVMYEYVSLYPSKQNGSNKQTASLWFPLSGLDKFPWVFLWCSQTKKIQDNSQPTWKKYGFTLIPA